jgi:hypothetical protein
MAVAAVASQRTVKQTTSVLCDIALVLADEAARLGEKLRSAFQYELQKARAVAE